MAKPDNIAGFPAILPPHPRVLILGSIPSLASLESGQYYGHPRNAFWPIMGNLLGFRPDTPYAKRVEAIKLADVAVWDVLNNCRRAGSLDSAIERDSERPNDIPELLGRHPTITTIACNGTKAYDSLRRYFMADLSHIQIHKLPSTSPANAQCSLAEKLSAWRLVATLVLSRDSLV